ncbi:MAG: glucose-1-phosphate cytidylyltransferase [Bacteroidales bacterium]
MVEIGDMPILWHIMKLYSAQGFNDFIICLGYKGYMIKEYFRDYYLRKSNILIDLGQNKLEVLNHTAEPWRITLVDTGEDTMTGGRILRVKDYIGDEPFFLTYGDGLSDVNLHELLEFHKQQDVHLTLTAIQPPGRFGAFTLEPDTSLIDTFREKPSGDGHERAWINGGFFVAGPEVFDYIEGDKTVWEREPMEKMAQTGNLAAFRHTGFWQPMDTLRDKQYLDNLWRQGTAPWKLW